jgi:heme-degrading monooxygenase HmoA
MIRQLESTHTTGFMGASTWISTERTASNEVATLSYWRSIEDIHAFALSAVHREAWEWWNKGNFAHLGIMHEVFEIPKQGRWEGVYVNYSRTGLGAVTRQVGGAGEWVVPIVEARGSWASSSGRSGSGAEDEKVKVDSGAV